MLGFRLGMRRHGAFAIGSTRRSTAQRPKLLGDAVEVRIIRLYGKALTQLGIAREVRCSHAFVSVCLKRHARELPTRRAEPSRSVRGHAIFRGLNRLTS